MDFYSSWFPSQHADFVQPFNPRIFGKLLQEILRESGIRLVLVMLLKHSWNTSLLRTAMVKWKRSPSSVPSPLFLARNCASSCYFWKTKIEMSAHVDTMLKVSTLRMISFRKVCKAKAWYFSNENSFWRYHTQNKMSSLLEQTLPRSLSCQQIIFDIVLVSLLHSSFLSKEAASATTR